MISPQMVVYAVLATIITGYVLHCEHVKSDRAAFISKLQTQAEEQQRKIELKETQDKLEKEKADAQNLRAVNALRDTVKRLRDERAGSSILPPAPANAASPNDITFNRPLVERAISEFVERTAGLVIQGDQAIADLDTAKKWSNSVLRLRLSELDSLPSY